MALIGVSAGGRSQLGFVPPVPKLLEIRKLQPFVEPLPIPSVAKSVDKRQAPGDTSARLPYYRIPIHEFYCQVHRDVPATRFWGYGGSVPGPTIEARSVQGLLVEWPNELPREDSCRSTTT